MDPSDPFPLSSLQAQIWFDQALDMTSPLYNVGGYLDIEGTLDIERFQRAMNALVARHDSLRLVLSNIGAEGRPLQRVADPENYDLQLLDFTNDVDPRAAATAWMLREFRSAFELQKADSLFHSKLLKVADNRFFWFMKSHHLIADGWSVAQHTRSLAALYNAHEPSDPARPLPPSYRAFVTADQEYVQSQQFVADGEYWLERFRQVPEPIYTAIARTAYGATRGIERKLRFSRERFASFSRSLSSLEASPFAGVATFLAVMIARTTGISDDFALGVPLLNRSNARLRSTSGTFVNMNSLKMAISRDMTFADVLRATTKQLRSNYRHHRYPISELNRRLGLAAYGRRQLFDVVLSYEERDHVVSFGTAQGRAHALTSGRAAYPLQIAVREFSKNDDVICDLTFCTDHFREQDADAFTQRLALAWETLDHRFAVAAHRMQVLIESDRAAYEALNTKADREPGRDFIHEMFEMQAERSPQATALVFEQTTMSYKDLNARANSLARCLRRLGATPDARIALLLQRSADMLVGILAILKAGAAYVPLDPAYPVERLRFMLIDSAPIIVITHGAVSAEVRAVLHDPIVSTSIVDCDAHQGEVEPDAGANLDRQELASQNLAYVIYTSGSTGKPKGVMIEHGSVVNRLMWTPHEAFLKPEDVVLAKTALSFDVSVWELLAPLVRGAQIVLPRAGGEKDQHYLAALMASHAVTLVHFVPSMFRAFTETNGSVTFPAVHNVVFSGEALSRTLVSKAFDVFPHADVYNLYGPTEATIEVTAWKCRREEPRESVPIGYPISNAQVHVVNELGELMPPGSRGELCISGIPVGRGYLNRSALTRDNFILSPLAGAGRLYKTGDVATVTDDCGVLLFGRRDSQIKLRGFRIELGEIEDCLRQHPAVGDGVVIAHPKQSSEPALTAYYVPAHNEGAGLIGPHELRRHLAKSLPDYMLPASYVKLTEFPLMSNGKVDRTKLPDPEAAHVASHPFAEPASDAEWIVARVWQETLGLGHVGRYDNFFELGGHSLMATRVVLSVGRELGVECGLSSIFSHPVLWEFAAHVSRLQRDELPPVEHADRRYPAPLTTAQRRLWVLNQKDPLDTSYNMAAALRLSGDINVSALVRALEHLVERHEALRTSFPVTNGEPQQAIVAHASFALVEIDVSGRPDSELIALAAREGKRQFNLSTGPLFRSQLLRHGDREAILLLTMHHCISDGWSVNILFRELAELYRSYGADQRPTLPDVAYQYTDYSQWQRRLLQSEVLEKQRSFWVETLRGAPPLLELLTDRPRSSKQSSCGAKFPFAFGTQMSDNLRIFSKRQGATLFTVLLGGLAITLSRLAAQDEVVIGVPVANRRRREFESVVGLFVNMLPIRLETAETQSVHDFVERTKARLAAAQEHQDVPFEQIVEFVKPPRASGTSPLFQVAFAWEDANQAKPSLPGLDVAILDSPVDSAKFDLLLNLADREGQIQGQFEYSSSLFDTSTIARYVAYFLNVLSAMIEDTDQSLDRLRLQSRDEQCAAVAIASQTKKEDAADEALIHALFEARVKATPAAIAVDCDGARISYTELNARANRLARHLRELGARPDSRIALLMERSIDMLVTVLAVLKAGGAYVPLDPSYPSGRLRFMLEDSAPSIVITHGAVTASARTILSELRMTPVVDLDDREPRWALLPEGNLGRMDLSPRHLAYIMYTSGSTGQPKGVMVEHRNVTRLFSATDSWFSFGPSDVSTLFHSFAFDVSVWEMWSALFHGGRLVVVSRAVSRNATGFYDLISREEVTVLSQTPTAFRQLIAAQARHAGSHQVKHVILAGEALDTSMLKPWFADARNSGARIANMYGITETTVHATYRVISEDDVNAHSGSPIGTAIPDLRLYVLDRHRELVPVGCVGEIYVGGAGVARGYFNKSALTSERFLPNPFVGGDRLYKSGDLARVLRDGSLVYIGRNDLQVKLRGFRIELGEIQARIAECRDVRDAVVIVREDVPNNKRLVAYVIADPGKAIVPKVLRQQLEALLPSYMLPAAFVEVATYPMTDNGKLDHRALPAPGLDAFAKTSHESPADPVEIAIAGIWRELLRVGEVSRNDDFFELGGDSLLATQLVYRIRDVLAVDVPVSLVFDVPILRKLCEHIVDSELSKFSTEELGQAEAELDRLSSADLKSFAAALE